MDCVFLNGTVAQVPVALIDIDTPYLTRNYVKAICLDDPVYDLIIGEVEGARCKCNPYPEWVLKSANAVLTRAETVRLTKQQTPLKVATDAGEIDIPPTLLAELQSKDETLNKVRRLNGIQKIGKNSSWYVTKNKILYRMFQVENRLETIKQVVVPIQLRKQVYTPLNNS